MFLFGMPPQLAKGVVVTSLNMFGYMSTLMFAKLADLALQIFVDVSFTFHLSVSSFTRQVLFSLCVFKFA